MNIESWLKGTPKACQLKNLQAVSTEIGLSDHSRTAKNSNHKAIHEDRPQSSLIDALLFGNGTCSYQSLYVLPYSGEEESHSSEP